jgi:hypothetical protein
VREDDEIVGSRDFPTAAKAGVDGRSVGIAHDMRGSLDLLFVMSRYAITKRRFGMTEAERTDLLKRYSEGRISATELRGALGGITYGDVLIELAKYRLALPRAPEAGRQERIAAARALLFPKAA